MQSYTLIFLEQCKKLNNLAEIMKNVKENHKKFYKLKSDFKNFIKAYKATVDFFTRVIDQSLNQETTRKPKQKNNTKHSTKI